MLTYVVSGLPIMSRIKMESILMISGYLKYVIDALLLCSRQHSTIARMFCEKAS